MAEQTITQSKCTNLADAGVYPVMKRPAIVGICLLAFVGTGLLLWKGTQSRSAQTPGNQVIITPDGQLAASPSRADSVTFVATMPKKTNSAPTPPASR